MPNKKPKWQKTPFVFSLEFLIGFEDAQRSLSNPTTQINFQLFTQSYKKVTESAK